MPCNVFSSKNCPCIACSATVYFSVLQELQCKTHTGRDEWQMDPMEALRLVFGQRVKELREAKGWKLDELGARLGKHRSSISRIENGKQNLTIQAILAIAEALDVSVFVLFGGRREDTPVPPVEALAAEIEYLATNVCESVTRLGALVGVPVVVTITRPSFPDSSPTPGQYSGLEYSEPLDDLPYADFCVTAAAQACLTYAGDVG